jgi:hypothetical protein
MNFSNIQMLILFLAFSLLLSSIGTNKSHNQFRALQNSEDLIHSIRSNRPSTASFNPLRTPTAPALPIRDTSPINVNNLDISGLEDANDAINGALLTLQSTNLAVQAAVSAIATCKAEGVVDCQQLKTMYNKTQEYIDVAANSFQQANASASNTIKISNKAKGLLNAAEVNAKTKANAKFSDLAAQIAQNAVAQAKVAATAVAQAAAQCNILVQIRCNECPATAATTPLLASSDSTNSTANITVTTTGS